MIDISYKPTTLREATAQSLLRASANTISTLQTGRLPKGDPFPIAKTAAILSTKNTSNLIPYCHPLPITHVVVEFEVGEDTILSTVTVKAVHSTGVEMEAMTGAAVAALTLYDMLKAVDQSLEISWIKLVEKLGGKSQYPRSFDTKTAAAVLVISDSTAQKNRTDVSGKTIRAFLEERGASVKGILVVPDDVGEIRNAVERLVREEIDLIVTTGGTGIGPRDVTPEAIKPLLEKELTGVAEAIRAYGQKRTPYACLSRTIAGVYRKSLLLALPGSPKAVKEGLHAVFPAIIHSLDIMRGKGH